MRKTYDSQILQDNIEPQRTELAQFKHRAHRARLTSFNEHGIRLLKAGDEIEETKVSSACIN